MDGGGSGGPDVIKLCLFLDVVDSTGFWLGVEGAQGVGEEGEGGGAGLLFVHNSHGAVGVHGVEAGELILGGED